MIAENSQRIIAARANGMKPADMVLIGLADKMQTNNPAVYAKPGLSYDWRWVRKLDVCLYVNDADDWSSIATDIAKQHPAYFALWNYEGGWGAQVFTIPRADDVTRPVATWKYEIDFLPWLDFQNDDFLNQRAYARDENGFPVCN